MTTGTRGLIERVPSSGWIKRPAIKTVTAHAPDATFMITWVGDRHMRIQSDTSPCSGSMTNRALLISSGMKCSLVREVASRTSVSREAMIKCDYEPIGRRGVAAVTGRCGRGDMVYRDCMTVNALSCNATMVHCKQQPIGRRGVATVTELVDYGDM